MHPNHVQECSSITPTISSRDFLHTIMCPRRDGQAYYAKQCLDGGQTLWSQCIHENEDHPFANIIDEKKTFTWEIYQLHDGKQSRKIKLLNSQVTMSSSQLNQHVLF